MSYNIVTINVSRTIGAIPSDLQQTSAILSFGHTLEKPGKPVLLTEKSDIDDLINIPIGNLYGAASPSVSGMVDFTLSPPQGKAFSGSNGTPITITISGCKPADWNMKVMAVINERGELTWSRSGSTLLGSPLTMGRITIEGSDILKTNVDSFFAQGNKVGTYLLELGSFGAIGEEIWALKEYIEDPSKRFYAFLVPGSWKGSPAFVYMANFFTSNDSMQYFFIPEGTPEDTNYESPYNGIKSVIAVSDETYPKTNAAAAAMWNFVSASPSEINKVPPMAFRYLHAVNANTAKNSILKTMVKQNINYVDTGAEGGISNKILVKGVTSDGNDMTYWYSVDWVQINMDLMLANAIINGSNNPINPLYYNQDGIDRLQQVAQGVFNTGVSYGLVNGQTPVSAVPFKAYTKNNPNDYGIGRYAGLSASYTPMRGFVEIIFNINVTMQLP